MTESTSPRIAIHVDIETWGKNSANVVVTQMAYMAVLADDPDTRIDFDAFYLPLQPQIDAGRVVDAETILWWMDQDDEARSKFQQNRGGDSDVLIAFVRSFIRKIGLLIQGAKGNVEIWAKGPQFDIVILESLFASCGEIAPWKYDSIRDLRTLMKVAGVSVDDVDSHDIVKHVALEDCRFQIRCHTAAMEKVGAPPA